MEGGRKVGRSEACESCEACGVRLILDRRKCVTIELDETICDKVH